MKTHGPIVLVLLTLAALSLQGCAGVGSSSGSSPGAGGSVFTGSGGASGVHCTTAMCVSPVSVHLTWAVEIDPSSEQSSAATEENPAIDLYGGGKPLDLVAAQPTTVSVSFTAPTGASVPSAANVVLTIPSLIPGRPALTFQAPTAGASTGMSAATLTVPNDRLSSTATLALVPLPPADQVSPPRSFSAVLANDIPVNIPTDDLTVRGTLLSAIAKAPTSTFVARAFQGGAQVSNAPPTASADGTFQLVVPSAAAAANPLTIQLTPQSLTDPWFVSNPVSLPSSPSVQSFAPIMLPAYLNVNQFNLVVESADTSAKVSGAVVTAQATIGTSAAGTTGLAGTTEFARSGTTDTNGIGSLSLLPGSANTPVPYVITVTSPANSPYASQCVGSIGVKSGGSTVNVASAPSLTPTPVMLATRAVLTGTVSDSLGYAVANVSVTATPRPVAPGACAAAATSASSTTTDAGGIFQLPLDAGTYQLDYDPPSGSSAPRFTDPVDFVVGDSESGQTLRHDVPLPAGGLVEGMAFVFGGTQPLTSATIRFFEPRCSGADCTTLPWLRGQTVTDGNGQFQIVVPLPQ
jgi:hypothetical protein